MATQYTTLLKLALPTQGELSGAWGDVINNNITSMVEEAVAGLKTINTWSSNSAVLSTADGTTAESRAAILNLTDTTSDLTGAATLVCPTLSKVYIVKNGTGQTVTIKTSAGSGIAVSNGNTSIVYCDGTNVVEAVTGITGNLDVGGNLTVGGNATVTGTTTFNGGTLTLGADAGDNVVFGADVNSSIIPNTDDTFDLGSSGQEWRNLYLDGTANIDALVADTADINGGTIDGVTLGTNSAITQAVIDSIDINGKVITMTGDTNDTAIFTAGTNGTLTIVTTDNAGTSANITITADGTAELAGTTVTLNSSGDITLDADGGTITFADAGSSLGTITSNGFTGNVVGNVTGNTSGTAATVTGAAQSNITSLGTLTTLTIDDILIDGKIITLTGSSGDTATITAGTNGTLDIATTDAGGAAGNIQITADGTAEVAGTTVTLDSAGGITLDADGGTITFADGGSSLGTITSSGYSGTAATVVVTDSTANTNFPIVFHNESNGLLDDTGALRYNPSTGELLVPKLTVAGTTTTVDTVTMNAANAIIFEGATADVHETTLTIVDPTADRTINLPNQSGTVPLLAAASNTAITSTPEELNLLDGATVVVGEINALDLGATAVGTAIASKAVILDSSKDYTGIRNLTISGELDAATLDISGDIDVAGTTNLDVVDIDGAVNVAADVTIASTNKIIFNDASQFIHAPSATVLDIAATDEIELTATLIDVVGNQTVSGTLGVTGVLTGTSLDISGDIDVDGTTNLDVVDIDGAVDMASSLTVAGNLSVNGGTIKLDGNFPTGDHNVALGDTALSSGSLSGSNNVALGSNALASNTSGAQNIAIGRNVLDANTDGINNVGIGHGSLTANISGGGNVAIGRDSLSNNTASNNTAVGYNALVANETGTRNIALGNLALTTNNSGDNNTALGSQTLQANLSGADNTAVGYAALNVNNTGASNTAVGKFALLANLSGAESTAVGFEAGMANTIGRITAVGRHAVKSNISGTTATGVGYRALRDSTGSDNTALGNDAGYLISTGQSNTIIGSTAGDAITTGINNCFFGYRSGTNTTVSSYNVAIGEASLFTNILGNKSVAIGNSALYYQNPAGDITVDMFNTAVGFNAGVAVTTGIQNTLIGNEAGDGIVEGARNTALGNRALSGAVAGSNNNTCIGMDAGTVTTGNNNTYVGAYNGSSGGCGALMTSGSNNTILGSYNGNQHGLDIRTASNTIVLSDGDGNPRLRFNSSGYALFSNDYNSSTKKASASHVVHQTTADTSFFVENSHASGPYGMYIDFSAAAPDNNSNYFIVGADTGSNRFIVYSDGDVQNHDNSYGAISDVKLKEQITDASSQWDDIKALTIRKYKMKTDVATGDSDAHWRLGVVAQEVETAGMNGLVKDNPDLDKNNNDLGTTTKTVKYSILYMKAVKALQEAMTRIETLEAKVATLEGE
jgi:hypothetical protein